MGGTRRWTRTTTLEKHGNETKRRNFLSPLSFFEVCACLRSFVLPYRSCFFPPEKNERFYFYLHLYSMYPVGYGARDQRCAAPFYLGALRRPTHMMQCRQTNGTKSKGKRAHRKPRKNRAKTHEKPGGSLSPRGISLSICGGLEPGSPLRKGAPGPSEGRGADASVTPVPQSSPGSSLRPRSAVHCLDNTRRGEPYPVRSPVPFRRPVLVPQPPSGHSTRPLSLLLHCASPFLESQSCAVAALRDTVVAGFHK